MAKSMTLKEYVTSLQEYLASHPCEQGLPVVTSCDDEGNGYNKVYFSPGKGEFEVNGDEVEAVCVN